MPNILIRDVPQKVVSQLKARARRHNRSLQQELKDVIESFTRYSAGGITLRATSIRKKLAAKRKTFTDSAELLREDRCR